MHTITLRSGLAWLLRSASHCRRPISKPATGAAPAVPGGIVFLRHRHVKRRSLIRVSSSPHISYRTGYLNQGKRKSVHRKFADSGGVETFRSESESYCCLSEKFSSKDAVAYHWQHVRLKR
ncbi:hypothetical protein [Azospirillum palustre]